jgi:hypothetical protein
LPKQQPVLDQVLDTFFHLPTLITSALVAIVIVWQMYQIQIDFGNGFIRLESIQGDLTLLWQTGCCQLDWQN